MRYLFIDGNHLAGRSWAALRDMETKDGRRSGAIFGFLRGFNFIHRDLRIDYPEIVVFWDGGRSAKRKELYPAYKAGRFSDTPTEEEIFLREQYHQQLNSLRKILSETGCLQCVAKGVEADDLLGIVSADFAKRGSDIIIYSGDHDLHQLVTPKIKIYDPRIALLGENDIMKKWGVKIPYIPLCKAITGDSSDNINGIKGVGAKRAQIILSYLNLDDPFGLDTTKVASKDKKWIDMFLSCRELVERNLLLMTIPTSWNEAIDTGLLTHDQAMEAISCMLDTSGDLNTVEFMQALKDWELNSILESIGAW